MKVNPSQPDMVVNIKRTRRVGKKDFHLMAGENKFPGAPAMALDHVYGKAFRDINALFPKAPTEDELWKAVAKREIQKDREAKANRVDDDEEGGDEGSGSGGAASNTGEPTPEKSDGSSLKHFPSVPPFSPPSRSACGGVP